jgi:hypothetical protein
MHFRTVRTVAKGDVLAYSYIHSLGSKHYTRDARRAQLRIQFEIDCACERCAATPGSPGHERDVALQGLLCRCGAALVLDLAATQWSCPGLSCVGRGEEEIAARLLALDGALDLAEGHTTTRVTPVQAVAILEEQIKESVGFLGRNHGTLYRLCYARGAAAQAQGDKVAQLQYFDKCLDMAAWQEVPNQTSALQVHCASCVCVCVCVCLCVLFPFHQ